MGQETEHGLLRVREESETEADHELVTELIVPDGGVKYDGAGGARLLFGAGTNIERALSEFVDYADAVTEIGSTPTTLVLNGTATISTAIVQPATLFTRVTKGSRFVKSGSGTITFQGFGLEDPLSQVPVFEGFNAGDVTWTGTDYPKQISSELHYYAHDRLGERYNFVDAALLGKYAIVKLYPRTIDTTQAIVTENHHIECMPGNFPNTWAVNFVIPILLKNNTSFRSNPPYGAIINESSVVHPQNIHLVGAFMMEVAGANGTCSNIYVEYNKFVGNAGQAGSSGPSTVILGNCTNGGINYNIFDRTHGYNVLGGYSTVGNFADNCTFLGNRFIGCGTQVCAVINGKNIRVAYNWFDQRDSNAGTAYTPLDVEPNISTDFAENIVIEENVFNITDDNFLSFAMLVQGTTMPGPRNVTIRNNTIFSGNMIPNTDTNTLISGIGLSGVLEGYVYGNTIRGAQQSPISAVLCRGIECWDNHVILSYDATGLFSQILLHAVAESNIYDNHLLKSSLWSATEERAGIYEAEWFYVVTTSGTQINLVQTIGWNSSKVYEWMSGLSVTINNTDYIIDDTTTNIQLDATTSIGTVPEITFVAGDVDTTANTITETAHGRNTGSREYLSTTGTLPSHTPPSAEPAFGVVFYYLIRVDANTLKLASTLENALAGTAIDLTTQGTGTQTISPVMKTKFSSNKFRRNEAPDGIRLEPTGTSFIPSLPEEEFPALTGAITTEAGSLETSITDGVVTLPKLASGPLNTVLGINSSLIVDPLEWIDTANVSITGADNKLTKTGGTAAWGNAGAWSERGFTGDFELQFTATESNMYRAIGLSIVNTDLHYDTIDYCLVLDNAAASTLYANGVSVVSGGAYVADTTVFKMVRVGTDLLCYNGATLFHTFTSVTGTLHVDTSLHDVGSTIGGVIVTDNAIGDVQATGDPIVTTLSLGSDVKLERTGVKELSVKDWVGNLAKLKAKSLSLGGAEIEDVFTGTATLNFDLTSVEYEDLTITVTGATVGDGVIKGIPDGSTTDVNYSMWVSAADTVKVRATRVTGTTPNPASGTFRATVIKF